jgi:hypothetical protein
VSKKIDYTCNTLIFEIEKVCGMTTFGVLHRYNMGGSALSLCWHNNGVTMQDG